MRRLLKFIVIDIFSLYLVNSKITGLNFDHGFKTFLLTAIAITVITILGKPILKILLLPLNLITFGLFNWIGNSIALYVVTLIVEGFRITGFYFDGLVSKWLDIPQVSLEGFMAYIAFSFTLSLISSTLHWLFK